VKEKGGMKEKGGHVGHKGINTHTHIYIHKYVLSHTHDTHNIHKRHKTYRSRILGVQAKRTHTHTNIYIYIYTHTSIYIYIYTYIYTNTQNAPLPHLGGAGDVEHALLDLAQAGPEVAGEEELDAVDLHLFLCVEWWVVCVCVCEEEEGHPTSPLSRIPSMPPPISLTLPCLSASPCQPRIVPPT
jgi:hypothetical protein